MDCARRALVNQEGSIAYNELGVGGVFENAV
jgi:hypothetical protein